ncbi:IS5 family transposase [Ruminococcaceae bacterium OttesenSCG-928-L11]|nr:IS5 family transposase [Ruminococcaceae bacterium OttesenSCG-928-L11]
MYKENRQMQLKDFVFPYGKLNPENEWAKLAELLPWERIEERYAAQFENNGYPAHPCRMALGALLIKRRLRCSDEWTVRHVSENPYLQYFTGMKEYGDSCPFGASTMVAFRKRFSEEDLKITIPKEDVSDDNDGPPDGGTLIMDATCCPADIAYPQDVNLLNEAREKLEGLIDQVCEAQSLPKPRTYREKARKAYLKISKSKKRTAKQLRKAVKAQLQYIRRDVGYIVQYVQSGILLTDERMNLMTTLYEQQRILYETRTHSIPHRIVSLSQPHIRPIPKGKARAKTEFGAKLHISLVNGYARMEQLSFEAYNEADDFFQIVERYRSRYGHYPSRILADRIYRNRETLAFCKEHGIRLTGPALGRPPKDKSLSREQQRQEYIDICDLNAVEGAFGTLKTAYGLGRVAARLEDTCRCAIGIALLLLNLTKRLRKPLRFVFSTSFSCFCCVFHFTREGCGVDPIWVC